MKGLLEAAYMLILTSEVCLPLSCASPGRAARLGSASSLADPRDLLLAVAGHEIPLQSSVTKLAQNLPAWTHVFVKLTSLEEVFLVWANVEFYFHLNSATI